MGNSSSRAGGLDECRALGTAPPSGVRGTATSKLPARRSAHDLTSRLKCLLKRLDTPMHVAAKQGNLQKLQALLRTAAASTNGHHLSAVIEATDAKGRTPLAIAAINGKDSCVELLLAYGANPLTTDFKCSDTALHHAAKQGHAECLQLLLQSIRPAIRAVASAPSLLDVEQSNSEAVTTEPTAASITLPGSGIRNATRDSVAAGRCNATNLQGFTPLHYATAANHVDCVQILLASGASLVVCNHAQGRGWLKDIVPRSTPLHIAARRGLGLMCKVLMQETQISSLQQQQQQPQRLHDAPFTRSATAPLVAGSMSGPSGQLETARPPTREAGPALQTSRNLPAVPIPRRRQQDPRLMCDASGLQPYMIASNAGNWLLATLLIRPPAARGAGTVDSDPQDPSRSFWASFFQLPGSGEAEEEEGAQVPTLSTLATSAWNAWLLQAMEGAGAAAASREAEQQRAGPEGRRSSGGLAGRRSSHERAVSACGGLSRMDVTAWQGAYTDEADREGRAGQRLHMVPARGSENGVSESGGQECELCCEQPSHLRLKACQHSMCTSCTRKLIKLSSEKGQVPLCPFCRQHIKGWIV